MFTCIVELLLNGISRIYRLIRLAELFFLFQADRYVEGRYFKKCIYLSHLASKYYLIYKPTK